MQAAEEFGPLISGSRQSSSTTYGANTAIFFRASAPFRAPWMFVQPRPSSSASMTLRTRYSSMTSTLVFPKKAFSAARKSTATFRYNCRSHGYQSTAALGLVQMDAKIPFKFGAYSALA
jgi:hypothetical protein